MSSFNIKEYLDEKMQIHQVDNAIILLPINLQLLDNFTENTVNSNFKIISSNLNNTNLHVEIKLDNNKNEGKTNVDEVRDSNIIIDKNGINNDINNSINNGINRGVISDTRLNNTSDTRSEPPAGTDPGPSDIYKAFSTPSGTAADHSIEYFKLI